MIRTLIFSLGCLSAHALAGPDLICSEISGATSYGFVDGKVAYSFGTTLCNVGDMPVSYTPSTNQHPLIVQSIYKLKDHRIEQIGIGFVRHTNIPLAGNACGLGCTPAGFDALGVGCSDTSSASINGVQSMMGPRTEVNAHTGEYPYPFTSMGQAGDAIYKRVQVELADVSDPDALYFVETQVIVPGELDASARNNNVSYRQVVFAPGSANASLIGSTYDQQPAIYAWRDHGNGIGVSDDGVLIDTVEIPGTGIINVASRVEFDESSFMYRYDYCIHNQSSEYPLAWLDHSASIDNDAQDITFSAPLYHDDLDQMIDTQPWSVDLFSGGRFLYRQAIGFPNDVNANTIRWGTTYAFSLSTMSKPYFESNDAMTVGWDTAANSGDEPFSVRVDAVLPDSGEFFCLADMNNDGDLNFFDVSLFLQDYNAGGDFNGDGNTDFFDVSAFLQEFNAGCP